MIQNIVERTPDNDVTSLRKFYSFSFAKRNVNKSWRLAFLNTILVSFDTHLYNFHWCNSHNNSREIIVLPSSEQRCTRSNPYIISSTFSLVIEIYMDYKSKRNNPQFIKYCGIRNKLKELLYANLINKFCVMIVRLCRYVYKTAKMKLAQLWQGCQPTCHLLLDTFPRKITRNGTKDNEKTRQNSYLQLPWTYKMYFVIFLVYSR